MAEYEKYHSMGVILATGGYDFTVKLWQAHSGLCVRTMQHPDSQVNCLDISPNKQVVAAGGYQHIRMYDLVKADPDPIATYDGISKNIGRIGFQEDSKWMYTAGDDCTARIWDLRARQCQRIFKVNSAVTGVFLHPNQVEVAVADYAGTIHMWDLRSDRNEPLIPEAESAMQDVCIDPTGRIMAAINNSGNVYVWSLADTDGGRPVPLKHIQAHSKYGLRCKFSPDGKILVTTSADYTAKLWSTEDWSLLRQLHLSTQRWVWDAAFSADSKYIFTGTSDTYARLWNVETGTVEREYCSHQKPILCLAFRDEIIS